MHTDVDQFPMVRAVKALHLLEEALVLLEGSGAHFACPAVKAAIEVMKPRPVEEAH